MIALFSNRRQHQIQYLFGTLTIGQKKVWIVDLGVSLHIASTNGFIGLIEQDSTKYHHVYKKGIHLTK